MDDDRSPALLLAHHVAPPCASAAREAAGRRLLLGTTLGLALAVVASLTLAPEGTGWAWGAPLSELRWYLTGLTSPATLLQLVANLLLLAVPAALAVRLWPALAHPARLAVAALAAGGTIEVLQYLLPLGRVVSPVDALLNAAGALVTGAVVAAADRTGTDGAAGGVDDGARPLPDRTAPLVDGVDGRRVSIYRYCVVYRSRGGSHAPLPHP
ncbi:hypothetical protein [Geodermatophilus sp. URMC 62]|uniref:hypothetical protein n=1 Tax=Geodermatophilus sp. URMC 62 TaxID=3423414 RepID=UPI00406C7D23